MNASGSAVLRRAACAAALSMGAAPASAANPSLSSDFGQMTAWLSHELAQGLAFNAGETFDPPRELVSRRIQPDLSVGAGMMPLDKKKFPDVQSQDLKAMNVSGIFPSAVLFPNMSMHLRAGLPGRMDVNVRFDNMTTPPGYHISPTTSGSGQSNSIGGGVRRHFFGGPDRPILTLGGNFNHVYGRFALHTKFNVDTNNFSADSDVNGNLVWNVSSFGFNAILSQSFDGWTPFVGAGYNYATGSVSARLETVSKTFLIGQIVGDSSEHPEQNSARVIGGLGIDKGWAHFFANGEMKAMGEHRMESWIAMIGAALPFEIGPRGFSKKSAPPKPAAEPVLYGDYGLPVEKARPEKKAKPIRPYLSVPASKAANPELIFVH